MKRVDRFEKNYGVDQSDAFYHGIGLAVWLALSSGSKIPLATLKDRDKKLDLKAEKWIAKKKLMNINPTTLIWASIIHNNYLQMVEWLREIIMEPFFKKNYILTGSYLIYTVYKTMDINGKTQKIKDIGKLQEILTDFKIEMKFIRKEKPKNMTGFRKGLIENRTFFYAIKYGMPPREALKEVVKDLWRGKLC